MTACTGKQWQAAAFWKRDEISPFLWHVLKQLGIGPPSMVDVRVDQRSFVHQLASL
jgi:hypothetical protein